ncbi:MAG: tetratricopeptide repeat protein [Myxococcaceae bacterium]
MQTLLVAAAAAVSHFPALFAGFTWLDHGDIESGAAIAPPAHWLELFTHGYARTGFYRPVTALSLSIDGLVGAPWMFHLTNVALHAAASVLLMRAALALGVPRRASVFAAILFAVHPVASSMVVDQITTRTDSLAACALFGLIAACAARRPVLALIAMLLGALSKETALVLGPMFVVLTLLGGLSAKDARTTVITAGVGWALALSLRLLFAPPWSSHALPLSGVAAVATRLGSVARSAYVLLVPDSRVCDAFPILSATDVKAWVGLIVAVVLIVYAAIRRGPMLFVLLALLPSLALVPVPRFWSPHYLYLPFGFLSMAIALEIDRLGRAGAYLLGAVALLWAAVSFRTAFHFHDDASLFAREVEGRPFCREAQLYLGDWKRQHGDTEGAAEAYLLAAAPTPRVISYSDEAAALQNLGLVRLEQKRFDEAAQAFRGALADQNDGVVRRQLRHNLAAAALGKGDYEEAMRLLSAEAARPDAMPESVELLARVLVALHRDDEAKALLSDAQARGILKR